MNKMPLLEVCVDSMESVREAVRGGADRLELCANLIIGGTTPSPFLIREAAKLGVPVNVLIRPRFGDFLFKEEEKQEQLEQIRQLNELAAQRGQSLAQMALSWILRDGIVTSVLAGASKPEQVLDNIQAAKNVSFTAEELDLIDRISGAV